jgi:hypothetical protein
MDCNEMLKAGGRLVCKVGLQRRMVIEYQGKYYQQPIYFEDGYSHSEMYEIHNQATINDYIQIGKSESFYGINQNL